MDNLGTIELARDCAAVEIPAGTSITLPKGVVVYIAQTLGGTYTVRSAMGLFRIANADADALGLQPEAAPATTQPGGGSSELEEKQVWEVLRMCFDPEIPVNIVDLGLVYDLNIEKLANGNSRVNVKMTLTAQGCGMGGVIAGDAQQKLLGLPPVEEANVEIVWDPPWHQSMITAEGRKILGLE